MVMKKILMALLCVFALSGCGSSTKGNMQHMKAADALRAIEDKETMILLVGKTDCSACQNFQKVIDEVIQNYDIEIREVYIDEDEVTDTDTNKTTTPNMDKIYEYTGSVAYTPTVFFIKDGTVEGSFTGSISYSSFKSKIEKYGFLPES